ncbi:MAG: hypothetical protein WC707_03815 [Candidatus Babeliaceae bacterium]|jgi:hypothetical protein
MNKRTTLFFNFFLIFSPLCAGHSLQSMYDYLYNHQGYVIGAVGFAIGGSLLWRYLKRPRQPQKLLPLRQQSSTPLPSQQPSVITPVTERKPEPVAERNIESAIITPVAERKIESAPQKEEQKLQQYERDSLWLAYRLSDIDYYLDIPLDTMTSIKNVSGLQQLFVDNQISVSINFFTRNVTNFTQQQWIDALAVLRVRSRGEEKESYKYANKINFSRVPRLLTDAKSILTDFLSTDKDIDLKNDFAQLPSDLNLLFTHALLRYVIAEKNLQHISLTEKLLLIKNKKARTYLRPPKSALDEHVKLFVYNTDPVLVAVNLCFSSPDYVCEIYEKKSSCDKDKKISAAARFELGTLIEAAPFTLGTLGGNIMADDQGDALIKGAKMEVTPSSSLKKTLFSYQNKFE